VGCPRGRGGDVDGGLVFLDEAMVAATAGGRPGFWPYILVLTVVLATHNVLFPNMSAAAMQPVGHVAGTAAAIFATTSTAVGAIVGAQIDGAFDDTVNPFSRAFLVAALMACVLVALAGGVKVIRRA
jgi:DHA1 family bicyclomycin/chloramphenicol resistance-like MFS transporter